MKPPRNFAVPGFFFVCTLFRSSAMVSTWNVVELSSKSSDYTADLLLPALRCSELLADTKQPWHIN